MIIACDIDGVLAQFEGGFLKKLLEAVPGKLDIPYNFSWQDITCWDWPQDQLGYTNAQTDAAWELVKQDEHFWISLQPYDDARAFLMGLRDLTQGDDDVYFCTHRYGKHAKRQTETWLRMVGWHDHPTVLLVEGKGITCKALQVDFYVDDKRSHAVAVRDQSKHTQGFLLKRGWNSEVPGVPTIETLRQFLNIIAVAKGQQFNLPSGSETNTASVTV